ncbi:MAG TPA: F0F1 ATP synthase subunit delta [Acidimicrobiales bacterium]|nr:F0F1 ATP synthase subunit delta [Acidimicrobiales bacterium]
MRPTLQGYAAAVLQASGTDVTRLADELESIHRTFVVNPALRAALTDTAVDAASRRAVMEDLLGDRVSSEARRAAGFAAAAVRAPDVPAAIDWLAQRARHAAEGRAVDEPALGHSEARERVGGFAAAVLAGLPVDRLEEVEDELFRFARIVESTPALRTVLTDRDQPLVVRQGLVDQLIGGKVQDVTLRLVDYVLAGGRARDTVGTLDWLVEQTARQRGWRVARVRAAAEVGVPERERLVASLTRLAGSPVELQVTVDPALLAGVVLEVGDLLIDASARGRLDALREHMSAANWEQPGLGYARPGTADDEEGAP